LETPAVSVVLAARNEASAIVGAVESILAQTLTAWELVAVDDGSTDGTAEVVEAFGDPRIRVIRTEPQGLPQALNIGLRAARAPIVARQDADDLSLSHRLERQVAFLTERPEVTVVGSRWREVGSAGQDLVPRSRVVTGALEQQLESFNAVVHTAATFRRDAILELGGYEESLPYAADYDLWLRVAAGGGRLWNLDEVLVVRTMGGTNMSSQRERSQILEELRIRARHLRRLRDGGLPVTRQLVWMARRGMVLLAPIPLRRLLRRRLGKAP